MGGVGGGGPPSFLIQVLLNTTLSFSTYIQLIIL